MSHLDGNALAGTFADLFTVEITDAWGTCASCGHRAELARARVSVTGMGAVMQCTECDAVLAVIVDTVKNTVLNLSGLASIAVVKA